MFVFRRLKSRLKAWGSRYRSVVSRVLRAKPLKGLYPNKQVLVSYWLLKVVGTVV